MAILKHIASKNADYGEAQRYLIFQYDEYTNKPVLDENGRLIPRKEYYLDGINCDPFTFDIECKELNIQYHKNHSYDEIKSHHYILSFDPQDCADHGLTGEQTQALGMEFASKNFPGHQALVCTHTDGHNHSGNIHVHIIINSLRKLDVEPQPFMERTCDSRAGYKHHLTKDYLKYLQQSLMDICQRENLYQVDLLSPASKKITEKEYWASRKGQKALNKLNQEILADGLTPMNTRYLTQKQFIREAVDDISASAQSFSDFKRRLWKKYQIEVIDKRGRFSYKHSEREKHISERTLGRDYGKANLLEVFAAHTVRPEIRKKITPSEQNSCQESFDHMPADFLKSSFEKEMDTETLKILFIKSDLRLVVDLQNCIMAQKNQTYAQKVKISNLQQMAKTVAYIEEHHFDTRADLQNEYEDITMQLSQARHTIKNTEADLHDINEQIHYTGQYFSSKPVFAQMLKSKNKKRFRQEHLTEIETYEAAARYLKTKNPDGKMPSMKRLKAEKEKLLTQKNAQYDTYRYFKDYQQELRTVCTNVDTVLGKKLVRTQEKWKESEL